MTLIKKNNEMTKIDRSQFNALGTGNFYFI